MCKWQQLFTRTANMTTTNMQIYLACLQHGHHTHSPAAAVFRGCHCIMAACRWLSRAAKLAEEAQAAMRAGHCCCMSLANCPSQVAQDAPVLPWGRGVKRSMVALLTACNSPSAIERLHTRACHSQPDQSSTCSGSVKRMWGLFNCYCQKHCKLVGM